MSATAANTQRQDALVHANRVRRSRAQERLRIRRLDMTGGLRELALLVERAPAFLGSAEVARVLVWPTRMQQRQVLKLLVACRVRETKPIGEMTDRQRMAVAGALRDMADARENSGAGQRL